MKKIITVLLVMLSMNNLIGQTIIRNELKKGESSYFRDGMLIDTTFYASIFRENQTGRYRNSINIYDQSLNYLDSIDGTQAGGIGSHRGLHGFFEFNHKHYVYYFKDLQFKVKIYEINGNQFTDLTTLDLDTIYRSLPFNTVQINDNRLRVTLYERDLNFQFVVQSKIIDLDSNFNIIDYHAFDFSQTNVAPQAQSQLITGVYEVSPTTWHIHTNRALHYYNTQTRTIDSSSYLFGGSREFIKVNSNEYLAMGIVSFRQPVLGLPYTGEPALGFYRVKNNGTIIDTSWFLNVDNNSPGTLDYSHEVMNEHTLLAYDSSAIFLASVSNYNKPGKDPEDYFFVVKTNSSGVEEWRYRWGDVYQPPLFSQLLPTVDKGCLIVGAYPYDYPRVDSIAAILIKLGPDGNISNVELDAPETVVNFYPNPVKDKLHYSILPEANDAYFLEIMDMQGKPVLQKTLENEKGFIPVNLQTGFYLYHLKDADGKVQQIGKIVAE